MNMKFILYFFLLFPVYLLAQSKQQPLINQEYSYRHYTTQDGLPQMRCNAIFQDSKGFIWVGTESGFSRYNGLEFQSFFPEKNLNIFKFYEDENGNIVAVGYHSHYRVLPNDQVEIFIPKKGLYFHDFYSMSLPPTYGVYVDYNNQHRAVYKAQHDILIKVFEHPLLDSMGTNDFCFVYFDTVESLWYVPTGRKGLCIIDTLGNILGAPYFFETVVRFNHTIYAVDYYNQGIFKKTKKGFKKVYDHKFTGNANFIPLNDTTLIIKCSNHIYRYTATTNTLEIVFSPVGISFSIRNIMLDNEGNIWAATRTGIFNLYKLLFKKYTVNFGIREKNIITTMAEIPPNTYYFGTLRSDLIKLNSNQTTQYINIIPPPIWDDLKCFFDGACVYKGDIYAASNVQLLKISEDKPLFLTKDDIFARGIYHINGDTLGITSSYGFYLYNTSGKQLKFYSKKALKQRGNTVWDFVIDRQGQKIVAGESGLSLIQNDNVKLLNDSLLFASEGLTRDSSGLVWVISENRLCTWDGQKVELVYTFPNCLLRSVKCVQQHYLIVATTKGFTIFDLREYYAGKTMQTFHYDQFNGFMGVEPLRNGIFEDSNGNVWLMSQNGVYRFRPEQLIHKQIAPRLHVLNFSFSTDNVKWTNTDLQSEIILQHNENSVHFSFIGLSYSATQHVRYQYCLLGYQNEWTHPQNVREAIFNNLPPGKYEFRLRAFINDEDSMTEISSVVFEIKPAIWQTWWFMVATILVSGFLIVGLSFFFFRRKRKQLFQKMEREMKSNLLKINSVRLKSIPHFNANVLAGIEYYMMNFSKEEANQYLTKYSVFTNITLKDIDKSCRSLKDEIQYVTLYLEMEKFRFMQRLDFLIQIEPDVNQDIMLPNMILHTFCENAMKHGLRYRKGQGCIQIFACNEGEGILLRIEDNGIGRAAARKKHTEGTGQGLRILTQQIELYNQNNEQYIDLQIIDLYDDKVNAAGTRIELRIPYYFKYI